MPATDNELVTLAYRVHRAELTPDEAAEHRWLDGTQCGCEEWHTLMAAVAYIGRPARVAAQKEGQAKAMSLLRSLLTLDQRRQLAKRGEFRVRGSLGGIYRLMPKTGAAESVTKHNRHYFAHTGYCLHDTGDAGERMPPADVAIGQLLLLLSDEGEFVRLANASTRRDQLWNGEYLRRMRRRHQPQERRQESRP